MMNHLDMLFTILIALVAYGLGVMHARNLNAQDRAYWMAQGALKARKEKTDDTE